MATSTTESPSTALCFERRDGTVDRRQIVHRLHILMRSGIGS
jgi:hypothetical protein